MTGAECLLRTLLINGVDTCFMNPGTSEMQFVAALDRVSGMRPVLGLFEGVCSGAADGYARIMGKPAATLLHLGWQTFITPGKRARQLSTLWAITPPPTKHSTLR